MPDARALHWIAFHALLLLLLAAEWLLLRKRSPARSYAATALWLTGAAGFGAWLYFALAPSLGAEFLAGYALEESLSIDNLFVFLLLFKSLGVLEQKQPKVLFWGILGAVVMRAGFIVAGVALLSRFAWITYVFAVLLLVAAVRLVMPEAKRKGPPRWQLWLQRHASFSQSQDGFMVQENGRRAPTVLLLTLIAIAFTDFVFALDSIPAVLSITRHTFVAYSSNVMAVMGLRSLYFVLAHALKRLRLLHYGLAAVLAFAAAKMLVQRWVEISALVSLLVIASLLAVTIALSLMLPGSDGDDDAHAAQTG